MDRESCEAAIAAAEAHDEVFVALGCHPNMATGFDDARAAEIRDFARHPRVLAIGETGLDYFRDYAPRQDQERAFATQIEIARDLRKPLVIHTRAAEEDTIGMLTGQADGLDVVLHCFTMTSHLQECLAQPRWWFSFAGNVTYPSAADIAEAATQVPLDRLLVETDAPYLSPQPVRKERNQSANVVHTARFVAERRGISYEELESAVEDNASRLLGW
jgi:TatD DNase family protein